MCVLRNLSYRLYDEMPPSALQRLEGRGRRDAAGTPSGEAVGCFTPQSRRLREVGTAGARRWGRRPCPVLLGRADPVRPYASRQMPLTADALTFAEVSKDPKGLEWLWSPQVVGLYNRLLQRCELNRHTTEAAAGALQNITAGDRRVSARGLRGRWGLPGLGGRARGRPRGGGRQGPGAGSPPHSALPTVGGRAEPPGPGARAHPEPAAGPRAHR